MHALRIAHTLTHTDTHTLLMTLNALYGKIFNNADKRYQADRSKALYMWRQKHSSNKDDHRLVHSLVGFHCVGCKKKRKKMTSMNIILCRPSNPVQESLCEGDAETCFPVLFETSS